MVKCKKSIEGANRADPLLSDYKAFTYGLASVPCTGRKTVMPHAHADANSLVRDFSANTIRQIYTDMYKSSD